MLARLLIALLAALALSAAAAHAGGFATVGLSSTPESAGAGPEDPWLVDVTILQHGRTPLDGLQPAIMIRNVDKGTVETFRAKATGEDGVYRAAVVFPSEGRWEYTVDDGFSPHVHKFAAVQIGGPNAVAAPAAASTPPAPAPDDDGFPWGALLIALGAGGAVALVTGMLSRRRGPAAPAAG